MQCSGLKEEMLRQEETISGLESKLRFITVLSRGLEIW